MIIHAFDEYFWPFLIFTFALGLSRMELFSLFFFLLWVVVGRRGKIITHKAQQRKHNHTGISQITILTPQGKGSTLIFTSLVSDNSANKTTACTHQLLPVFWLWNNQILARFGPERSPAPLSWKLRLQSPKPSLSWFSFQNTVTDICRCFWHFITLFSEKEIISHQTKKRHKQYFKREVNSNISLHGSWFLSHYELWPPLEKWKFGQVFPLPWCLPNG